MKKIIDNVTDFIFDVLEYTFVFTLGFLLGYDFALFLGYHIYSYQTLITFPLSIFIVVGFISGIIKVILFYLKYIINRIATKIKNAKRI